MVADPAESHREPAVTERSELHEVMLLTESSVFNAATKRLGSVFMTGPTAETATEDNGKITDITKEEDGNNTMKHDGENTKDENGETTPNLVWKITEKLDGITKEKHLMTMLGMEEIKGQGERLDTMV